MRFVPHLRPLVLETATVHPSGLAIIIGMGSIGSAIAPCMIAAGFSTVVFIGRRPATDRRVANQLSKFGSGRVASCGTLQRPTATSKASCTTAAVVSDATIDSVTDDAFARVIHPKVRGAYNLHMLVEELALDLDSFVMFSSISVPLGNPGQVAYVAANAFLDSLAAYRQSTGRPGVSIQLGPWESDLVENLPERSSADGALMRTMTHTDGLPLIIRALSSQVPVQVIVALNTDALSRIPAFAADSLFADLVAAPTPRAPITLSSAAVAQSVASILRGVLELADSEPLELHESLTACGIDSIAFGQIRAKVLKQLGVDVPLVFLSDAFTLNDMIANVQESVLKDTVFT
ncbi:KR domain-containing protein [Mycena vulgaris]|nr:KR domain-containing protein [Mycena vulgaris]